MLWAHQCCGRLVCNFWPWLNFTGAHVTFRRRTPALWIGRNFHLGGSTGYAVITMFSENGSNTTASSFEPAKTNNICCSFCFWHGTGGSGGQLINKWCNECKNIKLCQPCEPTVNGSCMISIRPCFSASGIPIMKGFGHQETTSQTTFSVKGLMNFECFCHIWKSLRPCLCHMCWNSAMGFGFVPSPWINFKPETHTAGQSTKGRPTIFWQISENCSKHWNQIYRPGSNHCTSCRPPTVVQWCM